MTPPGRCRTGPGRRGEPRRPTNQRAPAATPPDGCSRSAGRNPGAACRPVRDVQVALRVWAQPQCCVSAGSRPSGCTRVSRPHLPRDTAGARPIGRIFVLGDCVAPRDRGAAGGGVRPGCTPARRRGRAVRRALGAAPWGWAGPWRCAASHAGSRPRCVRDRPAGRAGKGCRPATCLRGSPRETLDPSGAGGTRRDRPALRRHPRDLGMSAPGQAPARGCRGVGPRGGRAVHETRASGVRARARSRPIRRSAAARRPVPRRDPARPARLHLQPGANGVPRSGRGCGRKGL